MSTEESPDDQIGGAIFARVVEVDLENNNSESPSSLLTAIESLHNQQQQNLVEQIALSIKVVGDKLNSEQILNKLIEDLARLGIKDIFSKLVKGVFDDGQINWGRIIVLFYAASKLAVKMVLANHLSVFKDFMDCCLDFIKGKLSSWIHSAGGWINSISELTQLSIKHSSFVLSFSSSSKFIIAFACGIMVGSTIVWKFSKST